MKVFIGVLLLATASLAREVGKTFDPRDLTAFNYHEKIGIPEATRIKIAEEAIQNNVTRIVGGSAARVSAHPYQAGLLIRLSLGISVCGASLLTNNKCVTAAHCWWDGVNQATQLEVVLGSELLFSGGTRVTTNDVFMHSGWSPVTMAHDIAIINIPWVAYTNNIQPIELPQPVLSILTFEGYRATASGFGRTSDSTGISTSQVLSAVSLTVMDNIDCGQVYGFVITENIVCTSGSGGVGTCGGDSGGPLVTMFAGSRFLLGVTSFGAAAGCQAGWPAAFVRVPNYVAWIKARL